jgi:hypothetical protein
MATRSCRHRQAQPMVKIPRCPDHTTHPTAQILWVDHWAEGSNLADGQWRSNLANGISLDGGSGSLLAWWRRVQASTVSRAAIVFSLRLNGIGFHWFLVMRMMLDCIQQHFLTFFFFFFFFFFLIRCIQQHFLTCYKMMCHSINGWQKMGLLRPV